MSSKVSKSEYSITGADDATGWFDLGETVSDLSFNITGTWDGTIALQVSNQNDSTKTRFSTVESYTANDGPRAIPRYAGTFFRFQFTAYTSGTAYIGLSSAIGASGEIMHLSPQGMRNVGVGA